MTLSPATACPSLPMCPPPSLPQSYPASPGVPASVSLGLCKSVLSSSWGSPPVIPFTSSGMLVCSPRVQVVQHSPHCLLLLYHHCGVASVPVCPSSSHSGDWYILRTELGGPSDSLVCSFWGNLSLRGLRRAHLLVSMGMTRSCDHGPMLALQLQAGGVMAPTEWLMGHLGLK